METHAYIDPGTGSVLVTSLWGVILYALAAAGAYIMYHFIRPLKRLFMRLLSYFKRVLKRRGAKTKIVALLVVVVVFFSFIVVNNLEDGGERQMKGKVLLIGIDAIDPNIAERLMSEGRMPNFSKLREDGGYSRLGTTKPPETPVAWSAAATGSNPGKYGIFDFIGRRKETYLPKLNLVEESMGMFGTKYSSALKGTPFWRITSGKGIPTTVIRWPLTFPPEKIRGRMLSGLGTVDIKGLSNSYSFYTTSDSGKKPMDVGKIVTVSPLGNEIETVLYGPRVRRGADTIESEKAMRIRLHEGGAVLYVDGKEHNVEAGGWSDWIRVRFSVDPLTSAHAMFRAYLLSAKPEFSMYVTSMQIDPENQLFDMTYPKGYGKELSQAIGPFYTMGMPEDTKAVTEGRISLEVFLEQIGHIGEERERMFWHEFDRFGEGVFAFGFDAGDRLQHIFWGQRALSGKSNESVPSAVSEYYQKKDAFIGEVLDRMDNRTSLIIFSDHGFTSFERAASINTWLAENGYMELKQEPTEEDAGELFKHVDWSRTKAYSLGFASIFINLKGREGKGIVEPGEKDGLIREIISKLGNLTDPKTGNKVISNLYAGEDIYEGDHVADAPDIVIGFERGYRMSWQNAVGGSTREIFKDNDEEWKGDHLVDGILVPGVVFTNFRISKKEPTLMDIAPTLLALLGLDVPGDMDGSSMVGE